MLKAIGVTYLLTNLNFKKMKLKKMSLANMQGKMSRSEMKTIMGGSSSCSGTCNYNTTPGTCKVCEVDWCKGLCYCSNGIGSCA
jgi:natural product precursor